MSRGRAATAAWLTLAGQVVFVLAWLVAGALEDGYSHVEQYVSELGAGTAENPWIVNGAMVLLGLTLVALAVGTREALPRRRGTLALLAFLALASAATALSGLFALECMPTLEAACERRFEARDLSATERAHLIASWAMYPTLLPIPFLLAWACGGGRAARPALVAGVLGVAAAALGFVGGGEESVAGLGQRFGLAAMQVGIALYAVGLLVWAGRPRRPLPSVAGTNELDPFRFLAPSLSGEGENRYALWTWGLRLPRRFRFERRVDYEGEALWRIHDTLDYEDGPRFERDLEARPLSPDRMLLTGPDMPGGGVTVLRPDGLELEPCWILVPWWGIHWPQRWRGGFRLDGPDTMRADFTFSMFGVLPTGRLSMRLSVADRPRSALPA